MTLTTQPLQAATTYRVPLAVRGAQALLLLPLGLVQLVATIAFSISLGLHGAGDWSVAIWCPIMASACITTGVQLGRRRPVLLRVTLGLLAAQAAFSTVKLAVYHEAASLVFFAFIAAAAALLALPASRRHFLG
jgi:hypothetical protein